MGKQRNETRELRERGRGCKAPLFRSLAAAAAPPPSSPQKHMQSNSVSCVGQNVSEPYWQTFCRAVHPVICVHSSFPAVVGRPKKAAPQQQQQTESSKLSLSLWSFQSQQKRCWIRQRTCSHWKGARALSCRARVAVCNFPLLLSVTL